MKKAFFILLAVILALCWMQAESLSKEDSEKIRAIERKIIADGRYEEGIEELTEILRQHPKDPLVQMNLGLAHYGLMKYEKAYEYFKKAKRLRPKDEFKRLIDYSIERIDKNRSILQNIENLNNKLKNRAESGEDKAEEMMVFGHLAMLELFLKERYYYPAIATAHITWLKAHAAHAGDLNRLSGDVYYSAMFYGKASEDYKKAIEEDPEDAALHHTLADCLVALGDLDSAQGYYQKAIDLYKKEGIEDTDPKISALKEIKEALPKKYSDIADLLKYNKLDKAEAVCKKRISLNPGDYVAIAQLGEIYWKRGDRRTAMKLFKRAVNLAPDYPIAHFLLGRGYFFQQRHKDAVKEFNLFMKKMDLSPKKDGDILDYYISTMHNICYLFSSIKRYESIAKLCKKIIRLKPDDQTAHYNLGVCYYHYYRDRSRAYNEFQKVIEIDYATKIADSADFFIDYMRRNPDPRFAADYTFMFEEY